MGYNTDFEGTISIVPALDSHRVAEINLFTEQRQCTSEDHNDSGDKPSLWCALEVTEDGTELRWTGQEKTYKLPEWIKYIIDNFLQGHTCNGEIEAQGEDPDDRYLISVRLNRVYLAEGRVIYENSKEI